MDHQAGQPERIAPEANNNSTNTIDFHSVIELNDYAHKAVKLDIDSNVTERPGAGKGASEVVAVNENVRLTENGHAVPEHVLNNLILTDKAHNVHLNDNTIVVAGNLGQHHSPSEAIHKASEQGHGLVNGGENEPTFAPPGNGTASEKSAQADVLPELSIENEKK